MTNPIHRRDLLRGTVSLAALGGVTAIAGGCATSGSDKTPGAKASATADNPLGVAADAPLDVVIFKGGYGDDYAKFAESLYQQRFPKAEIKHQGIQKIAETLQPRMVAGNPPDVIDNAGTGLDMASLISAGQLKDLTELFDAPSIDDPKVKVRDTMTAGVIESALVDGKVYQLNYVSQVFGFYYSKTLFDKHQWIYPTTWEAMLALCAEIKKAGIAPWTYQGKHPGYWSEQLMTLVGKAGGVEAVKAVDNLEPNAWHHPAVLAAAEALYQVAEKGYLLPGTEGLSHTEAQTAWAQGKAAFIPCGDWIENEMKGIIPDGFSTTVGPTPSLSASDKLPHTALYAGSSEPFIVPAQGRNVQGGLEFLRIMLSKAAAKKFTELTGSIPVVKGAADGVQLSPGMISAREALAAAGSDIFVTKFNSWYKELSQEVATANGELMSLRLKPAEWVDRVQKAADRIAADSSIKKFKR